MQLAPAHAGRVDDEERVQDGVDLGGPHDARQDRVALVGPHELGALQLDLGLLDVEADDHLDRRVTLEGLGYPAAPERAETGDEDAASHPSSGLPEPDALARL